MSENANVIFIGAGPGDPELLTLKALKYLQRADVVIADRLISPVVLEEYINPKAQIIITGKQGRHSASEKQEDISRLIADMARLHPMVVRLKGGDISVFSNIAHELDELNAAGIRYILVPGITAMTGAAAYAGIPLTARGYATGVRILTYYKHTIIARKEWAEMASGKDTLVFYMSANAVSSIVNNLKNAGASADLPFAVIEQATTPRQRVHTGRIGAFFTGKNMREYASPSLLIIGKVAALHEKYRWLPDSQSDEPYFLTMEEIAAQFSLSA
ncbi:MAG: uroporphyrinogen-III C-methyltransferase [Mucilaginibacter polytrichastri]|nr:uroporphyrinogen-III C-methyltransferase [Mucilaginibacter polytrichastri]